jgi:tetratricopeptide (TPR) repeat protein
MSQKYQEALDISNKALRLNSHNDMAYNSKGLAPTELKRYDDAIECFDKALEINRYSASAWMHKGNAFDILGNHKEAMICYAKAKKMGPKHLIPLVLMNEGVSIAHLGENLWFKKANHKFNKAISIYRRERDLHPGSEYKLDMDSLESSVWLNKAWILRRSGKYKEAEDAELYGHMLRDGLIWYFEEGKKDKDDTYCLFPDPDRYVSMLFAIESIYALFFQHFQPDSSPSHRSNGISLTIISIF